MNYFFNTYDDFLAQSLQGKVYEKILICIWHKIFFQQITT